MARTIVKIPFTEDFNEVEKKIASILTNAGYKQINRNNEMVWKNGVGMLTAMKYVKVEYDENTAIVSAWIQVGLGSVGGKEQDLSGAVGAIPKKQLSNLLKKLQEQIK